MTNRIARSILALCIVGFPTIVGPLPIFAADEIDFDRDVRPILATHCFACHGPDEQTREADLRLDRFEDATADLGGRAAIQPGDPDASELVRRIESDDEQVMPPADSGNPLSELQKLTLRRWIAAGGKYDVHWSLVKPVAAKVLAGDEDLHPIDRFVQAKLAKAGLAANEPADRYQLIRRVTLDLIGLPPTTQQTDAFVNDNSHDAFEKVVDRLLASESFGEHWTRMWLDLARYADTKGYEKDNPREIWRYRDWLIDAFNADMPFDQFTIEQLAGDLLADANDQQRLATAFHRNTLTNEEGGTDDEEFRIAAVKDRVDTTMQVWMGLTMGCAKCHSHKYDPISQVEYYRFLAFFNQTADADRETPLMNSPTKAQLAESKRLRETIASLRDELENVEGFDEAYQQWLAQNTERSLWQPLKLVASESEQSVAFEQSQDHKLIARGKLPDKDTVQLTFDCGQLKSTTAIRLESFPKIAEEGNPKDKNHVINELTIEIVSDEKESRPVELTNARADFSQNNWEVAKSIDGNVTTGWAVSPKADQPHVAIFDLVEPIQDAADARLIVRMQQLYGNQLVLSRFRISGSSQPTQKLEPTVSIGSREEFRSVFPATRQLLEKIKRAEKSLADVTTSIAKTPVMQELPPEKARQTRIHRRGNFLDQGEIVEPGVPAAFGLMPNDAPLNRLGVAQWIVSADNPLTARVMVNRIWARLFGIGIVETEEDFGTQGLRPSHPELLDWLAIDFRQHGWSLKQLLKTIVMSSTYQQSSHLTEDHRAKDPRNRLLGRGPRFRMSAEMMRDQALAASGLLTNKIGGPSVMPPQPDGVWKTTYSDRKWINADGEDRFRRGLYTYWKRTSPYPSMTTFDAGSGEVCLIRRVRTNTPLQALIMLNDPCYFEAAGALALLMENQGLQHGFRRILTRPPTEREITRIEQLFNESKRVYETDLSSASELIASAGLNGDSVDPQLAAWIVVAGALLNLDETVTKP